MPLDLINLEKGPKVLSPGDRGFLINLTKARWVDSASYEAIRLLRNFTQLYYETKCPEVKKKSEKDPESQLDELEELELEDSKPSNSRKEDHSGIEFAVREIVYPLVGFVACNLADPADFAHFVLTKLADINDYKKPRLPFRILPVQRVCEAKTKAVEECMRPLLEETIGSNDVPYRFSIIYRGHGGGEKLTQKQAVSVVRNSIWAMNPNCVQCIKYQDFAILIDILDPLFMVGVAKDFQKLASYNTWIIRHGIKPDPETDSEDEISDDPTLDEEAEKKRKLRIKRKRRTEKAGLTQANGDGQDSKRERKEEAEDGDGEGDGQEDNSDEGEEDGHAGDDVADALISDDA